MGTLAQREVAQSNAETVLETQVRERTEDIPELRTLLWNVWAEQGLFDDGEIVLFLGKVPEDACMIWDAFLRHHERHKRDSQKDSFFDFVWICIYRGFPG